MYLFKFMYPDLVLTYIFIFIFQVDDEHTTNKRKYLADDRSDSGKDLKKVRYSIVNITK